MEQEIKSYPPRILDLLSEVFEEEDKVKSKEPSKRHYPSSASFKKQNGDVVGACLRQLWYRATGEVESNPRDMTSRLQAGFGQAIHDYLLNKLAKSKKLKIIAEANGRIHVDELENEISYRLDGQLLYRGEPGGLEIKTMQSYGLQRMIKEAGPRDSHILQVLSYFMVNPSLRWFSLVYFGRDSAYRAEYHIVRNGENFDLVGIFPQAQPKRINLTAVGIVQRWKELEEALRNKRLPRRDFKAVLTKDGEVVDKRVKNYVEYKTDVACQYCAYQKKCWSLPDAKDESIKVGE